MASNPITSQLIDGETMETLTHFIFLSSKITADGDCSHEIKRCLLLGRKVMTNLDRILKSRDMIWENGIETCILSCKNRIASLCPMQDTACLGLVHGDDPEGCCGEGGSCLGTHVHLWWIHVNVWQNQYSTIK